jgi:hypothetical protein
MIRRFSTRVRLVMFFFLFLGVVAYATRNQDPLKQKYQEVLQIVFGVEDKLAIFSNPDESTGGLFSTKDADGQVRAVPLRNYPPYDIALVQVRSLKQMIESEAEGRGDLPDGHQKLETLLEVISKYIDFQRVFYLNYLANLHESSASLGAFRVDDLNLKLNSRLGLKLVIRKDLKAKYHVRHAGQADSVDLFIPPYEKVQLEATALSRAKTKIEYQKFLHFMYLRDSLVNRWALKRISPSGLEERVIAPPSRYDSFAGEKADLPSRYRFSSDLGVEDRYESRIKGPLREIQEAMKNMPLGTEEEYRQLVLDYSGSFSQFGNYQLNPDLLMANLFDVEERTISNVSQQVILEANFPQDDLSPAAIAKRTAHFAFLVRKSGILKTLLYRMRGELAVWEGHVNPDDYGMISEDALLASQKYVTIPKADLARAEKVVDAFFARVEPSWEGRMAARIEALYRNRILISDSLFVTKRNEDFFRQTIKVAGKAMFHLEQSSRYDALKKKFSLISSDLAESLDHKRVPLEVDCASPGGDYSGVLVNSCVTKVKSDLYLSGLDASADAGMAWTIPWTPEQIRSLLAVKLKFLQENDPEKWEQVKNVVQDPVLSYFFEELAERNRKVILERKSVLEAKKLELSEKLAKLLNENPAQQMEETDIYREMALLQAKMDSVGIDSRESTLSEEMYEEAANHAVSRRIKELDTPPRKESKDKVSLDLEMRNKRTITVPDKTRTAMASGGNLEVEMKMQFRSRERTKLEIARVFSLLGFGADFLSKHFKMNELRKEKDGMEENDFRFEARYPKADEATNKAFGGILPGTQREKRGSALSEIARSAHSQKLLSEVVIEGVYAQAPFLRIREGDDLKSPTGLERLFKAYSPTTGWNRAQSREIFDSLVATAIRNDAGKVEDAIQAKPELPEQDVQFQRIFKSLLTQRSLFLATLLGAKKDRVRSWEETLQLETRTTGEVWNDWLSFISSVLMGAFLVFLFLETLPLLVAACGYSIPAASAAFSGFFGGMFLGVLNGGNYLVQLFFLSTIVSQGNLAFFSLPSQMEYEREIANSTVGLTASSERILLPSERVSQEQMSRMDEQVQSAKMMTGLGAAIQIAFLPIQVKSFLRWSGSSGRAVLSGFGATSPEVVESMKQFSLKALVKKHGYAKGGQMYLERYRAALVANKTVSSVNGGATLADAQVLLANSMSARFSHSTELASFFEARIGHIKAEVITLQERSLRYFNIIKGGKPQNMEDAIRIFLGNELGLIKFRLQQPSVRIGIEASFRNALLNGEFPEIVDGTGKHLLTVFLLKEEAESLMFEAAFLRLQIQRIRAMESASGGAVGTRDVFLEMSRLGNIQTLDHLLEWGVSHPDYQASGFARILEEARESLKGHKIIVDDIEKLTPREREIYKAMQGDLDVTVGRDLTLRLGPFDSGAEGDVDFLILPGSEVVSGSGGSQ